MEDTAMVCTLATHSHWGVNETDPEGDLVITGWTVEATDTPFLVPLGVCAPTLTDALSMMRELYAAKAQEHGTC